MSAGHMSDVSLSRKRKHTAVNPDESNPRKALRLNKDLHGSDQEVDDLGDDEHLHPQPTGAFAHIKSATKRHKLEREARKLRKLAARGETVEGQPSDAIDSEGLSAKPVPSADVVEVAKKPKRQKEKTANVDKQALDEDDINRLEKHASVLKKFDKAQKRVKVTADTRNDAIETTKEQVKTIVDPLEPIHIDLSMPIEDVKYSALPSWVTSAKRVMSTSEISFEDMGLSTSTTRRLEQLSLTSAMPVQQAIVPLLLPSGTPGSHFKTGTDLIVPDLAVAAPTGSGKTLGYVLPIVEALQYKHSIGHSLRALIVVPTRELVTQVAQLAEDLTKGSALRVGTASGAGKLRDEQQKLIEEHQTYKPEEYARLHRIAQLLANSPDEDSPLFDDYIVAMDHLDDDTRRQIDAIVDCPVGFLSEHKSAIDILVCTPGRLLEHLDNTTGFDLAHIAWLVLDEADKLLDEQYDGFLERLHQVLSTPHTEAQQSDREVVLRHLNTWQEAKERRVRKIVLSATMTQDISQLMALKLQRPQLIIIGAQQYAGKEDEVVAGSQSFELPTTLREYCVPVDDGSTKPLYLLELLNNRILPARLAGAKSISDDSSTSSADDSDSDSDISDDSDSSDSVGTYATSEDMPASSTPDLDGTTKQHTVLVFTASSEAALRLTYLLKQLVPQLSSQLTCLTKASSGRSITLRSSPAEPCIVISTDRAGRGLDKISGRPITHVVQYDVPRSIVSYIHRVGRTARAGRRGQAWTLYSSSEARWFLKEVTKAASIVRAVSVQRVKLQIVDERLQKQYEEALAGMKELVHNRPRST